MTIPPDSKMLRWCYYITFYSENYGFSILLLLMRLWVAKVFFLSGLTKLYNWSATLYLFKNEYHVPLLSPELAAYLSVFNELVFSTMIAIGLLTRFSTIPVIVMTGVIQFTYDMNIEHLYWAFILFTLLLYGPGFISIDHLLKRKFIG